MSKNLLKSAACDVACGQKAFILAVLMNAFVASSQVVFGSYGTQLLFGSVSVMDAIVTVAGMFSLYFSFFGIVSVGRGLEYSMRKQSLTAVLMLIPFVNIVTLLVLSNKATKFLKDAGYKVGLFGARALAVTPAS